LRFAYAKLPTALSLATGFVRKNMSRNFASGGASPSSTCAEQKPSYAEKNNDGYYLVYCLPSKKLAAEKGYADYRHPKPDERLSFRRENSNFSVCSVISLRPR
jgi:hypothetical protein